MADIPFYDLGPAGDARRKELHDALDRVIDGGFYVGGPSVSEFENAFAGYVGANECVGVGNGLDGLRIGMEALGIKPGDEVIVPGFTFYASWLAITQLGAVPVPVDVDVSTASLDIASARTAITPRTKAIMVVHLYGIPADLDAHRKLADEAGIWLVEDAAQSHGALAGGVMTGSVGDFASFSFYPTKNLGAFGDAGAIVTNSETLAKTARSRRSYGQGDSKYDHVDSGWNSRLDTLQAEFLSGGLARLELQNIRRREIASKYLDALGVGSRKVIGESLRSHSVWHHFVLRTADRDAVRKHFVDVGIGTDIHYPYCFDDVTPLKQYSGSASLPNSRTLSRQVLSFPISPLLTDDEVDRVAAGLASLPLGLIATD